MTKLKTSGYKAYKLAKKHDLVEDHFKLRSDLKDTPITWVDYIPAVIVYGSLAMVLANMFPIW